MLLMYGKRYMSCIVQWSTVMCLLWSTYSLCRSQMKKFRFHQTVDTYRRQRNHPATVFLLVQKLFRFFASKKFTCINFTKIIVKKKKTTENLDKKTSWVAPLPMIKIYLIINYMSTYYLHTFDIVCTVLHTVQTVAEDFHP